MYFNRYDFDTLLKCTRVYSHIQEKEGEEKTKHSSSIDERSEQHQKKVQSKRSLVTVKRKKNPRTEINHVFILLKS